jgi:mRNA interferase RelE/StbE
MERSSILKIISASLLWITISALPLVAIIYLEIFLIGIVIYAIVGIAIFIWLKVDSASYDSLKEDLPFLNSFLVSIFWYPLLSILPLLIIFVISPEEFKSLLQMRSLSDVEIAELYSTCEQIKKTSNEKIELFKTLEKLESDSAVDQFYLSHIKPKFAPSRELSERVRSLIQDADTTGISFDEYNLSDFTNYYQTNNYNLVSKSDTEDIYVDSEDARFLLTGYKELYMPADTVAYMEEKKKEISTQSKWTVFATPKFKRSLNKISKKDTDQVIKHLIKIMVEPRQVLGSRCKPLSNDKKGLWRYRIGKYRVLYEPDAKEMELIFLDIGTRSNVYKNIH